MPANGIDLQVTDKMALKSSIGAVCEQLGFEKFAFFSFQPGFAPSALYSDGFPLEDYLKERYFVSDPILYRAEQELMPFAWDTANWPDKLTKQQQIIFNSLRSIDVEKGVAVSVRGPLHKFYVLCMSLRENDRLLRKLLSERCPELLALVVESCVSIEKLDVRDRTEVPRLSQREIECLYWVSEGKTAWETAHILEVSERTVNFHLGNAMSKLDTHSKHRAAIKAISLGLLSF